MSASGDVLLPLIILSVVKCSPPHLVLNVTQDNNVKGDGGGSSTVSASLDALKPYRLGAPIYLSDTAHGKIHAQGSSRC